MGGGDPGYAGLSCVDAHGEQALVELGDVFQLISEEYLDRKQSLPADTTEIVHA